jgi:polyisoprenoid-binding protein YceI
MKHQSRSALPAALLALLGAAARLQAADAPALPHYVLDPAKSTLEFTFTQAGARNKGRFTRFQTLLDFAPENLVASHLAVTIEIDSLDTPAIRNATTRCGTTCSR